MESNPPRDVVDIEVLEDFSATARCDEGFLQIRRLRCRNRRSDGSASPVYRVDVVDRPTLDAVAVVIYRHGPSGIEVLTRQNLRPAAYFRKGRAVGIPDGHSHLKVEEVVAGVLEATDRGELGLKQRAALEVAEEAGLDVDADDIRLLGGPFFVAPGIISEKIFLVAVDATGKPEREPSGDGSPLEEGFSTRWRSALEVLEACRSGALQDAKTEIGVRRLLDELVSPARPLSGR